MNEIEQLREDIATLEAAKEIFRRGECRSGVLIMEHESKMKQAELAKLEAEAAAKADPWAIEKQVIETLLKWSKATHGNAAARYARHLECQVDNISAVAEVFRRDFESARNRIAELEAELAKKPVVWCLRHRDYGYMLLLGETQIFPTKESAELAKREDWIVEPYTGVWK